VRILRSSSDPANVPFISFIRAKQRSSKTATIIMAWRSSGTTNEEMVDNLKRKFLLAASACFGRFRAVIASPSSKPFDGLHLCRMPGPSFLHPGTLPGTHSKVHSHLRPYKLKERTVLARLMRRRPVDRPWRTVQGVWERNLQYGERHQVYARMSATMPYQVLVPSPLSLPRRKTY
jgi:hypothetical protein